MEQDSEVATFGEDPSNVDDSPTDPGTAVDCQTRITDCAEIAADHLLRRALGKAAGPPRPGLYVVIAPADAWVPVLARMATKAFLRIPRHGLQRAVLTGSEPAVQVVEFRPEPVRGSVGSDAQEAAENELAEGRLVVAIGSSLLAVPPALRRAADRVVHVPAPDRRCLLALLRAIDPAGRPPSMRGLDFVAIGPASLRLSYRRGASGSDYVRRLRAVVQTPRGTTPNLHRLHGVDEVRRWASELKSDLEAWRLGRIGWTEVARGLLLVGPPGTGKTTTAEAVADHAGVGFIGTSYANWQARGSGHLGDVLKGMVTAFNEARERAPSILFIDELDSVGVRGSSGARGDWWRAVINALLEQMDGAGSNEGVILIAATNDPESIDKAILRSGRLEDRLDLGPPDSLALARILADELDGRHLGVDLHRIALMAAGATGADIVRVCKTARRWARREARLVTEADLLAALSGDAAEAEPQALFRTAVHEAGHAVVAAAFDALTLGDLTIVRRGDLAGSAAVSLSTASRALTPKGLDALLAALMGGRAAEEVILGEISAGAGGMAGSDLGRATQLAAAAELQFGFRTKGLIWYPRDSAERLVQLFARRPDIEATVQRRLDEAHRRAREVIEERVPQLRLLAEQLIARRAMTAEEVTTLMRSARSVPRGSRPSLVLPEGGGQPCAR